MARTVLPRAVLAVLVVASAALAHAASPSLPSPSRVSFSARARASTSATTTTPVAPTTTAVPGSSSSGTLPPTSSAPATTTAAHSATTTTKPAPTTTSKPAPTATPGPSKPVHLAVTQGGDPCLLFQFSALQLRVKGTSVPSLEEGTATFVANQTRSRCPEPAGEASFSQITFDVNYADDTWTLGMTLEVPFAGLLKEGNVVAWSNLDMHTDLSGTHQGEPVSASQTVASDTFRAARGFGYQCTLALAVGGEELSLTFENLMIQPFNVNGPDVVPAPGGQLDACAAPERASTKAEAAIVISTIVVLACICVMLILAIVNHYHSRSPYARLEG